MGDGPKSSTTQSLAEQPSAAEPHSRFDRLKSAFDVATQRVNPGEEIPDMPKELGEWGRNTATTMFAGICFLGARQVLRHRRLGPYVPQQAGLSKAQQVKLVADENTKRLLRVVSEAVRGGIQFGSLAGLFYGVQTLSTVANGEKSVGDTVVAAAVAGSMFGSFCEP